eukprot:PLAT8204.3.p1 GENE.PLAT8204.3~~PLAT8204.3.p1  ORF type:complete len:224 (+),score=125.74 PLAT8204.3:9-680(+)
MAEDAPAAAAFPAGPADIPEGMVIYSDDAALGAKAPSLDSVHWLQGSADDVDASKPLLIVTFAKFAKGDWVTVVDANELAKKLGDSVTVVGLSLDPSQEQAEKFLTKLDKDYPELGSSGIRLEASFPLAWDRDRVVNNALMELCGLSSIGASSAFLINAEGTIVWREKFSRVYALPDAQLPEQIRRLLAGEALIDNGAAPEDDEEEDDDDMDMGDMGDDMDLF